MSAKRELQIWIALAIGLFAGLWVLGNTLLPFILGAIVAYLFNPVVGRIEQLTGSRLLATAILVLAIALLVVAIFLAVIPVLFQQGFLLVEALPAFFESFAKFIESKFGKFFKADALYMDTLRNVGSTLSDKANTILNALLRQANSLLSFVMLIVITPVVTVYLLIDWNRMLAHIDGLLPRQHAPAIRDIFCEIDQTLASFLRGQGMVCLLLGIFYAIGLSLSGLNFAILIGATAGLLTFIPYLGAIIGAILAIGAGFFQFWGAWEQIAIIAIVFAFGQFIEGNILTPKLVGKSIGLHPVWILLALSVFGKLFGFVGVLSAVPIAAVIGVLVRRAGQNYKKTKLYKGGF